MNDFAGAVVFAIGRPPLRCRTGFKQTCLFSAILVASLCLLWVFVVAVFVVPDFWPL